MNLTNPNELKNIINAHGFSFSKSLGQNFLIDESVLDDIVSGSGIDKECGVLEIGPGAGTLTRKLAASSKKTVAVEIDKKLLPILNYTLNEFDNTKVINADIMETDIDKLISEEFKDMPVCVVANLPYYITTPIIMMLLEGNYNIHSLTFMVQKEVAERMASDPGSKKYGALSVAVQYYTSPHIICKAEPHCFLPQPNVASLVIRLDVLEKPAVSVNDKKLFFNIVKSAFGQRRKTLLNALSNSPYISIGKQKVSEVLNEMGLDQAIRGERLSLSQFAYISNKLQEDLK